MTTHCNPEATPGLDWGASLTVIAQGAGALALRHQGELHSLAVESKGALDYVTRADREVESFITSEIARLFPGDAVMGEEGASRTGASGRLWVIDPIDGTHNFIRGMAHWGVSIGVLEQGRPLAGVIYQPALGVLLTAQNGRGAWRNGVQLPTRRGAGDLLAFTGAGPRMSTPALCWLTTLVRDELRGSERRLHCATAALAALAQGQGDLYLALDDHLWDVCAGFLILQEVGLTHTLEWSADPTTGPFACVAGLPAAVDSALHAIRCNPPPHGLLPFESDR